MINSPLNYTGNKWKLLEQIIPLLMKKEEFVDVFAGSGLVGLNSKSSTIVLNDNNNITIQLLKYFKNTKYNKIIKNMDFIISKYNFTDSDKNGLHYYKEEKHEGLSKYNKEAFNLLKDDYNNEQSIAKLFALIIFGFNHYIRFNSCGVFNVPVGKVDYSTTLRKKTKEYCKKKKKKNVIISNKDFRDKTLYENLEAFYYFDPPYLITQAPYNTKWNEKDEIDLLN